MERRLLPENWDNVQVAFFDPGVVGNIFYNTNGQNFHLKGIETRWWRGPGRADAAGAPVPGTRASRRIRRSCSNNNPDSPAYRSADHVHLWRHLLHGRLHRGQCTISWRTSTVRKVPRRANAPPIQFSLRVRYDWAVNDLNAYFQVGTSHVGHSFTQAGSNPPLAADGLITTGRIRFENPAYSTWDAAIGCSRGAWNLALIGENLTNSNKAVFMSTDQFIVAQTPLRPRVFALNVGYKF